MNSRTTARSNKTKPASRKALLRAVASSTAVETRQPVSRIETRLRAGNSRFKDMPLA